MTGFRLVRQDAPDGRGVRDRLEAAGLRPRAWGNAPGETYGWHDHSYHKVLYCLRGTIVFHARDGRGFLLRAGDRLDIEPNIQHAATVGPDGVECLEAAVHGPLIAPLERSP